MTNFTTRLIFRAAILVVAAGAASAQTLNAEIPFKFWAGDSVMAPGSYRVSAISMLSGRPAIRLNTADGHHPVLLVPIAAGDAQKTWQAEGNPVLSFQCTATRCSLATIWTGPSTPAYLMPRHKLGKDEPVRTALIEMHPEKTE